MSVSLSLLQPCCIIMPTEKESPRFLRFFKCCPFKYFPNLVNSRHFWRGMNNREKRRFRLHVYSKVCMDCGWVVLMLLLLAPCHSQRWEVDSSPCSLGATKVWKSPNVQTFHNIFSVATRTKLAHYFSFSYLPSQIMIKYLVNIYPPTHPCGPTAPRFSNVKNSPPPSFDDQGRGTVAK